LLAGFLDFAEVEPAIAAVGMAGVKVVTIVSNLIL
jgi:hypothetical protein